MLVQNKKVGTRGMFFVVDDGNVLAEMIYTMPEPGKMIIEHTEVSDELRGQNVGFELVRSAVEYARKHQVRIVPLCTFAHSVFQRKPEFGDVLFT